MTHSGTVDVGFSIYAMKNFTTKGRKKTYDPSFFHAVPWPQPSRMPCLLLPLSYSSACQTFKGRSAAGFYKGQAGSHVRQCLDFFPNFSVHEISTATLVSHHFHLFWSLKPTGGCTLCIFPWRTQEVRNNLCTLAASWRKIESAPPSRQHELNSMA